MEQYGAWVVLGWCLSRAWVVLKWYKARESRALTGRAIFTESGIVDGRRRARHCGDCQRPGSAG